MNEFELIEFWFVEEPINERCRVNE